jgi:hypothetical protein
MYQAWAIVRSRESRPKFRRKEREMNSDDLLKNSIKNPRQIGNKVLVYNGNNEVVEVYPTLELGKAYFSMSNDSFFDIYGFNFVPRGTYWGLSKKLAGKM